jgi:hypothetical protein
MLPRLRAEESLLGATRVAVGSGALEAPVSSRHLAAWERQARGELKPSKVLPAQVGAAGIGVRTVLQPPRADVCTKGAS